MCVEDDKDTCDLLTFLLSDYQMIFTESIEKSLEVFNSQPFDLCILDNRLPDGSGTDLCKAIRLINPLIPIIFASGVAYPHEIQKSLDAGAQAYLTKPYSPDELEQIVKDLIEKIT